MLIEMNRFLTMREIERLYQIPPDVLPLVMADVPEVRRAEEGEPQFAESHVDRAVDDYAAKVSGRQSVATQGKPGRRKTAADIALTVNQLKAQGKTWKEIVAACKGRFPGRVTSVEQLRTIWRRQFQGKK